MSDLIKRQDAIDAVNGLYMHELSDGEYLVDAKTEDTLIGKFQTIDALADLPSAQPEVIACGDGELKSAWIPCSERLPEVSGRYFITRGLKAAGAIWNRVYIANFSDLMGLKDCMIFWEGNVGKSDFVKLDDVIAWMPLPTPYKEVEENEDRNSSQETV